MKIFSLEANLVSFFALLNVSGINFLCFLSANQLPELNERFYQTSQNKSPTHFSKAAISRLHSLYGQWTIYWPTSNFRGEAINFGGEQNLGENQGIERI